MFAIGQGVVVACETECRVEYNPDVCRNRATSPRTNVIVQVRVTHANERKIVPGPTACACCGSDRLRELGETVTEMLEVIPPPRLPVQQCRRTRAARDGLGKRVVAVRRFRSR
jgi:transposase